MTYAIIGTGAIGGYYGARLAQSGCDVHFLFHSDFGHVREHGLYVQSVDGDVSLPHVRAYADTSSMPRCDVVVVALKTVNNHLLPSLLGPLLRSDTLVLLIQNGIGVEEDAQRLLPGAWIAAGMAFICSAKTGPGRVCHQCFGSINLGNFSCPDASRMDALVADLCRAGVQAQEVPYATARWKKAVWNMPFNGMTVALETSTDRLLANPATRLLIREQMLEVIRAAAALGVRGVEPAFADEMIATTDRMTPYAPSMKLDHDYGRPMELDYLYTRPLRLARQAGAPMTRLEMLEAELRFIAAR